MDKERIVIISVLATVILLPIFCLALYLPHINQITTFNADFITAIRIIKDGKEITITNPSEIKELKPHFEGYYSCQSSGVNCFGLSEMENYRKYGDPIRFPSEFPYEVELIGENKTVKLLPTMDDCGYYLRGPLSFLRGHFYMIGSRVMTSDELVRSIESRYDYQ